MRQTTRGLQVFCKKSKSILKRQRQNERDRLLNKTRSTRIKTSMKQALSALSLVDEDDSVIEEKDDSFMDAEKKISLAFKAIDQAVRLLLPLRL